MFINNLLFAGEILSLTLSYKFAIIKLYKHDWNKFGFSVPWLRRFVAGLPSQRAGFAPRSVHVGLLSVKVALGLVYLSVLRSSPCQWFHRDSSYSHLTWGTSNRPVGDRSSETSSHPLHEQQSFNTHVLDPRNRHRSLHITKFDAVLREIKSDKVNQSYNTHGKYKNRIQMLYRK
jgi:hypothetical protein